MSFTAFLWAVLAVTFVLLSLRRPMYAVAFYMMTFFAAPELWWWGGALPSLRYALLAGFVLLAAVLFYKTQSKKPGEPHDWQRPYEPRRKLTGVQRAAICLGLNATFVHFALSSFPATSLNNYTELIKFVVLFFLLCAAVPTRKDFRAALLAMVLGAAYIGYEVTVNDRGNFRASRLEGVGAPAANTANSLASVTLLMFPLAGAVLVDGKRWQKLAALAAVPFIVNLVLLCNSRGAFLGLIATGITLPLLSRGATRKRAILTLAVGSLLVFSLLGDPEILQRFMTTFVGSEERDTSASSRVTFWKAGLLMVQDFPLGDGGGSFKFHRGGEYLARAAATEEVERSLHNGYLTELTEWGIQGLLLRMWFTFAAAAMAYRTTVRCVREGRAKDSLIGLSLIAGLVGFLITCMFGSFMSNEWGFWIVALLARYSDLYAVSETAAAAVPTPTVAYPQAVSWQPAASKESPGR